MSKTAYVFPGQGSQFSGMGAELYSNSSIAKEIFEQANDILGFRITDVMFTGSDEELRQTKVTQPAIFIHSVVLAATLGDSFKPDLVAGHSLGEFSALVAAKALNFESGLRLVAERALAMQMACDLQPGTMAAVLGLDDAKVEEVCNNIDGVVVAANYNCPGQLVISGAVDAINLACEQMKAAGAKRALVLQVGGAFHSPLMEAARTRLQSAIEDTLFNEPICPIIQNVDAKSHSNVEDIKSNLIQQLTAPVRWTQSVRTMWDLGANRFIEVGPGKVLQGLVKKIASEAEVLSA
jgi:[acyl-carrier-protein] S-malonyltransferase